MATTAGPLPPPLFRVELLLPPDTAGANPFPGGTEVGIGSTCIVLTMVVVMARVVVVFTVQAASPGLQDVTAYVVVIG